MELHLSIIYFRVYTFCVLSINVFPFKFIKALFWASSKSSAFRIVPWIPRGCFPGIWSWARNHDHSSVVCLFLADLQRSRCPLSAACRTFSGPIAASFSVFQFQTFPPALLAPLPVLSIILPSTFSPALGVDIPSGSFLVLVCPIPFLSLLSILEDFSQNYCPSLLINPWIGPSHF